MKKLLSRVVLLAASVAALATAYSYAVRPWFITWGAAPDEVARSLPGDEIIPDSRLDQVTRAITIDAPAEVVWPWLAQIGQDRGGFYSYEILEDLVGAEMPDADRVHSEFQHWKVGDKLWMYPPDKVDGAGHAVLAAYEEGRVLGFATRQAGTPADGPLAGSWTFVLEPVDDQSSRLLIRGRTESDRGLLLSAYDRFLFDPAHFAMERKMMEEIKLRAEGGRSSKFFDNAQVVLWVLTFVLFLTGAALLRRRNRWQRSLVAVLIAGALFQFLTFGQPHPALSAALATALALFLLWPERRAPKVAPSERLNKWLPGADFRDIVVVQSREAPATLMRALHEVTPRDMPLAAALGWLRYLPARLSGGTAARGVEAEANQPFLLALTSGHGNVVLEKADDEIILGMAGKLHQIRDQEPVQLDTPQDFLRFARANHEKLAISIRTIAGHDHTALVLEHRTLAIGEQARRRFGLYWRVIRPAGGFVSRELLKAAVQRARRSRALRLRGKQDAAVPTLGQI